MRVSSQPHRRVRVRERVRRPLFAIRSKKDTSFFQGLLKALLDALNWCPVPVTEELVSRPSDRTVFHSLKQPIRPPAVDAAEVPPHQVSTPARPRCLSTLVGNAAPTTCKKTGRLLGTAAAPTRFKRDWYLMTGAQGFVQDTIGAFHGNLWF